MAASHGLQVAVQSVKAMPDNKVPEIWGESVTQQGAKIAVELVRWWSLRMCAQNDERKTQGHSVTAFELMHLDNTRCVECKRSEEVRSEYRSTSIPMVAVGFFSRLFSE